MRFLLHVLFIGIMSFSLLLKAETSSFQQEPQVRVRLFKTTQPIQISGFGVRFHFSAANGESVVVSDDILPRQKRYLITRTHAGWGLTDLETKSEKSLPINTKLKVTGEMLKIGPDPVPDQLQLELQGHELLVVGVLSMQSYLEGVLPSEMPWQWPMEALRAQAIAARSYVMHAQRYSRHRAYDVDATTNDQVYKMRHFQSAGIDGQRKISAAISDTRGQYLLAQTGEPFQTLFHADCGGQTEEPRAVWGGGPATGTVKDSHCLLNPKGQWQNRISRDELTGVLKRHWSFGEVGIEIQGLSVAELTGSGRIQQLRVKWSGGEIRSLSAQDFRRLFGYNRVKSTNFNAILNTQGLVISGRGHGHGAGMCQMGARFMALAGANYKEIIRRYYPRAKVSQNETLSTAMLAK